MNHNISKNNSLFSIRQAARACNISRSTLIRLEEKGLLVPARTEPDSGYRYYNNDNIARVLQIRKFQDMGFNTQEISFYFASEGRVDSLLAVLEKKLTFLQQQVEEMRMRSQDVPDMSISIMRFSEIVCCMRHYQGASSPNKYDATYDFFNECVKKGYVLTSEPLFIINERTDYLEGHISSEPHDFYICVPVLPEQAPEDAVHIPACTAISLLYYGSYSNSNEAHLYLGKQVRERGLTPAGYIRSIGLVAPYMGQEIDPSRYCSQLVLPIEEKSP